MKWMVFALLVCAVNGRPQIPPCGEVTISCAVDQVLIFDENQSKCACVAKVNYDNPETHDEPELRYERQLDEDQVDQANKKPVEAVQEQKPVPLPGQEAEDDPIRRQSGDEQVQKVGEVCKDPLHNPAKKRQGVEKPALAVDPVEVVKPVKPVKPVHPIQPEERPGEEEGSEGGPDADVDTKPAPEDQGNDRRRRQSEGEDQHQQVKPEDKPVEVVGQTRPLPLPSIEGQPGQTKPAPLVIQNDESRKQAVAKQDQPEVKPDGNQVPEGQVGVVETKPAPSEGQGDGNRRQADNEAQHPEGKPPVVAVPLPGVAVKPVDSDGEEVGTQPAAEESDPAEPAGGKPNSPAPARRVARMDDYPHRQTAQRFRPQQQQERQDPFDFPDPAVPEELRPDDGQVQPDQPVISSGPVPGSDFSVQPGNDFNGDSLLERQDGPDDEDDLDVDAGNVELNKEGVDPHVDADHLDGN